jgi:(2Fe-2S) ferredoxin
MNRAGYEILVCSGPTCAGVRCADQVYRTLVRELAAHALDSAVRAGRRKCFGFCQRGPNVYVRSLAPMNEANRRSALYHAVAPADVPDVVHTHVLGGRVLERLLQVPEDAGDELDSATGHGRADIRLAVASLTETQTQIDNLALADIQAGEPGHRAPRSLVESLKRESKRDRKDR